MIKVRSRKTDRVGLVQLDTSVPLSRAGKNVAAFLPALLSGTDAARRYRNAIIYREGYPTDWYFVRQALKAVAKNVLRWR